MEAKDFRVATDAYRRLVELDGRRVLDTSNGTDCATLGLPAAREQFVIPRFGEAPIDALLALVERLDGRAKAEGLALDLAVDEAAAGELLWRMGSVEGAAREYRAHLTAVVRGIPSRHDAVMASRLIGLYRILGHPPDAIAVYHELLRPICATFPSCGADEFVEEAAYARRSYGGDIPGSSAVGAVRDWAL